MADYSNLFFPHDTSPTYPDGSVGSLLNRFFDYYLLVHEAHHLCNLIWRTVSRFYPCYELICLAWFFFLRLLCPSLLSFPAISSNLHSLVLKLARELQILANSAVDSPTSA